MIGSVSRNFIHTCIYEYDAVAANLGPSQCARMNPHNALKPLPPCQTRRASICFGISRTDFLSSLPSRRLIQ